MARYVSSLVPAEWPCAKQFFQPFADHGIAQCLTGKACLLAGLPKQTTDKHIQRQMRCYRIRKPIFSAHGRHSLTFRVGPTSAPDPSKAVLPRRRRWSEILWLSDTLLCC